ncbi:glutathione S-transferase family protein [Thalassomonas viridans]|uniref:Glutathione S-transferase family protein n=1 Tax=Thalassomonas viridans TaxID=137584 RepID=A0AAE9Z9V1_9GAMM|nr:glutathione S-transferase family protein [Thalassomonas viridans]WDE07973.1 glutathione S-transferase family protein [Thalassomonas viridans]
MSKMVLTYFDIDGGRGEAIRLALNIGGIDFEDERFPFSEFPVVREKTPLYQVPVILLDDRKVTQSNAILRYIGKQVDLYPRDNLQALLCDEILDAIEDATDKLVATFGLSGDELKSARQALVAGPLTLYLQWAEAKLAQGAGDYFIGNRLSIADLKAFVWTRALCSGILDHIPTDLVQNVAPKLHQHLEFIAALPPISQYYANRG